MRRDVDGLFRMHQRRKFDSRRGRRLGSEDHVVIWTKPQRPEWNMELNLRSIKDVMQMDVLRCTSPETVENEI